MNYAMISLMCYSHMDWHGHTLQKSLINMLTSVINPSQTDLINHIGNEKFWGPGRIGDHICNGIFHTSWNRNRTSTDIELIVYHVEMFTLVSERHGPGPIVSYCASPVPCTGAGTVLVQIEYYKPCSLFSTSQ